ncbi:MAG: TetR/AcrR family transcriptional regulator [Nocardia sp.]|nr:TetR/AcrR family transcriptional regulator [Nocardia sp.]
MTTHRAASPAVESTAAGAGRVDGRKRRWHQHKIERKEELVDGTLAAIRTRGSDIGMDEIAAEIGVSKTVLYRYFSDKSDLTHATMERFVEATLMPRVYEAISDDTEEYLLVRNTINAYVRTIDADTDVYRFIMSNSQTGPQSGLAEFQRLFAELIWAIVQAQVADRREVESEGLLLYSYVIVGGVQLSTDWWIDNRSLSIEAMLDHLTMMIWSAIDGMVHAGGSPERFNAVPHRLPDLPDPVPAVERD